MATSFSDVGAENTNDAHRLRASDGEIGPLFNVELGMYFKLTKERNGDDLSGNCKNKIHHSFW
jgi:hypothetical protein